MTPRLRVFFALWPPVTVAESLCQLAGEKALQFGGKPTRQESIHMTLAFLGDVAEERLGDLIQSAGFVRKEHFALCVDKLGYWHHNHLLWAGSSSPSPELIDLVRTLHNMLTAAGFAPDRNANDFAPHITLVRKLAIQSRSDGDEHLSLPSPCAISRIDWLCTSFQLVRSHLSNGPPRYRVLAEFPLYYG